MKKVLAAGGLVFNDRQELLMIFRYGKWDLPKGHYEKGETLEQCALREVAEETGLKALRVLHYLGVTRHTYYDGKLAADVVKEVYWFAMHADEGEPVPLTQEGIEEVCWVAGKELDQNLSNSYDTIREIVAKALAMNTRSTSENSKKSI